jgi:hypothetical protein
MKLAIACLLLRVLRNITLADAHLAAERGDRHAAADFRRLAHEYDCKIDTLHLGKILMHNQNRAAVRGKRGQS